MSFLSKLNHRKLTASSLWMPKRYLRYYHHNSSTNIRFGDKAKTTKEAAASAVVVVILGSCSAAYVVLVLPLFCELSTIQVRKELLIYMMIDMHFHQFQKVCAWRKFLCTSIIAQVTTILLRIFFEYKYTDDVYEKPSNSVRCTSKFNFNVLPV